MRNGGAYGKEVFTPDQSQSIVDAILKGYKSYLDERIEREEQCMFLLVMFGLKLII